MFHRCHDAQKDAWDAGPEIEPIEPGGGPATPFRVCPALPILFKPANISVVVTKFRQK